MIKELHAAAQKSIQLHAPLRAFASALAPENLMPADVRTLALKLYGEQAAKQKKPADPDGRRRFSDLVAHGDNEHLFNLLFEKRARELLFKLPNQYWFWELVAEAAGFWELGGARKLSRKAVVSAAMHLTYRADEDPVYRKYMEHKNQPGKAAPTPVEMAYLVAKGFLLVPADPNKLDFVENALFFDPECQA